MDDFDLPLGLESKTLDDVDSEERDLPDVVDVDDLLEVVATAADDDPEILELLQNPTPIDTMPIVIE